MKASERPRLARATAMKLLKAAAAVSRRAYAPYSKFQVGAALLAENGAIFTGCNVENASYGLTICAERNAVFQAVASGHQRFIAMAIVSSDDSMPYPCGACRQVLAEFGRPDLIALIAPRAQLNAYKTFTLADLLPHMFHLQPPLKRGQSSSTNTGSLQESAVTRS